MKNIVVIALLLCFSCGQRGNTPDLEITDTTSELMANPTNEIDTIDHTNWCSVELIKNTTRSPIPFYTIFYNISSWGIFEGVEKENFIIESKDKWDSFLTLLNTQDYPKESAIFNCLEIDFSKHSIIAAIDEFQGSLSYKVEIIEVKELEESIIVTIQYSSPKPGAIVATAICQPYHIITISKPFKPIFIEIIE